MEMIPNTLLQRPHIDNKEKITDMYRATSDNQHNTYMHWVTTQNSNFLGKLTPIKLSD